MATAAPLVAVAHGGVRRRRRREGRTWRRGEDGDREIDEDGEGEGGASNGGGRRGRRETAEGEIDVRSVTGTSSSEPTTRWRREIGKTVGGRHRWKPERRVMALGSRQWRGKRVRGARWLTEEGSEMEAAVDGLIHVPTTEEGEGGGVGMQMVEPERGRGKGGGDDGRGSSRRWRGKGDDWNGDEMKRK